MTHREEMLQKAQRLAQSYVPEWKFDPAAPDAGSALAVLLCDMLAESGGRLDGALHKHRLQYLNLFDDLKTEPIQAARSFVRFHAVSAGQEPVFVPKGTRLLAHSPQTEAPVVFETQHGLTVSGAAPSAIYATNRAAGQIVCHMAPGEEAGEAKPFPAFGTGGENLEHHRLLLGFDDLPSPDAYGRASLLLELDQPQDAPEGRLEAMVNEGWLRFALQGPEGDLPFANVAWEQNAVRLEMRDISPQKTPLLGEERYVIALEAEGPADWQVTGARLHFGAQDAQPLVERDGTLQPAALVRPFGVPMQVYAQCALECPEVLDHPGAVASLAFNLRYEQYEQALAELAVDQELKVVMRRPRALPKQQSVDVVCDEIALEYLGQNGWRPLDAGPGVAGLFRGETQGKVQLSFRLPADMLPAGQAGGPRLRLRLLRADGLYQVPSVQLCPVLEEVRLSYRYEGEGLPAAAACAVNNFERQDLAPLWAAKRAATPFYTNECEWPALYLGFEQNPQGSPASLYLALENNADAPLDILPEARVYGAFARVKVADGTQGLLYSGALLLMLPADMEKHSLFGHEMYWLRLVCYSPLGDDVELPRVAALYPDMAAVANLVSSEEQFYLDGQEGAVTLTLAQKGLIDAKVYLNEEEGARPGQDNWVLWQKGRAHHPGRLYGIDLPAGQLHFSKNVLAAWPPRKDAPAVKVVYQCYHGDAANVPAGAIDTLAESIRGVARVENPVPAFGGRNGYNEETGAAIIGNLLRTRGQVVTRQDYFDLISQVCYGVRRVKCVPGVDISGAPRPNAVVVAVLIDEYAKGGHIFSAAKQTIYDALMERSALAPLGKSLYLCQPRFVRMSARLWLECEKMDTAYDLQKQCADSIAQFIDPLAGNFEGEGWEIGDLPNVQQLTAYLKLRYPGITVARVLMTAEMDNREYAVDEQLAGHIRTPFAMAVNGRHVVHVGLAPSAGG